ncbi:hypothetical protein DV735_g518, partial [Chaetothyriales sp. CBS 134920]
MQTTIRTTALLFFIMLFSVASTSNTVDRLPWKFIIASLGANWLMMVWFAIRLHRYKAALYPLMFIINPFMNWIYMVYGIFTAGQRTWGGPRADAGAADAKTSPQEAIEHAAATGDDLNIIPETFGPALQNRQRRQRNTTLQPSSSVEGRFVAAVQSPSGFYGRPSGMDDAHHISHADSADFSDSDISIHTPRQMDFASPLTQSSKVVALDEAADGLHLPEPVADPSERLRRVSLRSSTTTVHTVLHRSPLGRQSPLLPEGEEGEEGDGGAPVGEKSRWTQEDEDCAPVGEKSRRKQEEEDCTLASIV